MASLAMVKSFKTNGNKSREKRPNVECMHGSSVGYNYGETFQLDIKYAFIALVVVCRIYR